MNKSKSPIPTTKWGTACAQCAAAKAKCSRQSDKTPGSKCDRCERLLKTCTEQVQRPRKLRQARTRKESSATVSSSCGDTCGSLLPHAPSTSISTTVLATSSSNFSPDIPFQLTGPSRSATSSPSNLSVTLSPPPPSAHRTSHAVPPTSIDTIGGKRPRSPSNPTLDEDALIIYVTQIQPTFPFILVPSNVNSQALAVERPLLMGAVRIAASTATFTTSTTSTTFTTSSTSTTTKVPESTLQKQVYHFINTVSNSVMLRGEANLETLMAIVIVLGRWRWWCTRHGGGVRFNTLLGVAEGLVVDLGLNRSMSSRGTRGVEGEEQVTDDEKRLLLGVWYLRSCAAINLSQLSPTNFPPYLQQCLDDLEMSSQASDQILVQVVKVQHLEQRIAELNDELLANPGEDESAAIGRIVGLKNEWGLLNRTSHPELMHNPLITSHLRTTFLRLHDPLLPISHPPTPTVLTHLYASALGVGIHFPPRTRVEPGTGAGAGIGKGTGAGAGTTAMIFQPFVDAFQNTILSVSGKSASGRLTALTALPTPIVAMHLAYFVSLLLRVCFSLSSTSVFIPGPGAHAGVQDLGLAESVREQLPLLGVGVSPEFLALLLALAESVTETSCLTAGGPHGATPARIMSILSKPSAFCPLVLEKWVSFAINGGVLPSGSSSSITASGPGLVAMSISMPAPTSHPGLSSPSNPALLSVSAARPPFPTTDSEYEDYELDFDVDVDMALSGVSGAGQGMQYGHGGGYHQSQGLASGCEHHQPQIHGQGQQQQWSVESTAGGWLVSSPEQSMGVYAAAAMFWEQGHGGVQQGHSHGQHQRYQGQGGWGPLR